jgi:hypothetical protein
MGKTTKREREAVAGRQSPKALGLIIAPTLLAIADEVIDCFLCGALGPELAQKRSADAFR